MGGRAPVGEIERELTMLHAEAVKALLRQSGTDESQVVAIGFHGQTILHEPDQGRTWQIGDGALLARQTGIDVVNDFRSRDIAEGGQGAPLVPLYHAALAAGLPRPIAVLNIGGVANVTWIGNGSEELLAFDTGPGNALLNDWVQRHLGVPIDRDGALARAGRVRPEVVARFMSHSYFGRPAPKSLDRDAFDAAPVAELSPADGAATLTAFTVAAVVRAALLFPNPVKRWLVTGGGRHNPAMMAGLSDALQAPVAPVESVGWNGDALEAQAFAYLAIRSLDGLPLSLPGTTGVMRPVSGGRLHRRP
jgi:anhydro-N-acetylmuramic acid kinase